jgi:DNA invertase Pin-like site-specific DNA recombinase
MFCKDAGCARLFNDIVSGAKEERPGLQEAIAYPNTIKA